jgi:hypothetical protein
VFIGPGKNAVFIQQQVNGIESVEDQSQPHQSFVINSFVGFPAKEGSKQVDGNPEKRVRIIVLQPSEQDKEEGENEVERLHGPKVKRNWF